MAISSKALYQNIARNIGSGAGSDRLAASFCPAINYALSQMSLHKDAASRIALITDAEGTIAVDAEYEYIVYTGAMFWLIRSGHGPKDPRVAGVVYEDTRRLWFEALNDYIIAEDNEDQSDSTFDIGPLGDVD